jgi:hypothetical protein
MNGIGYESCVASFCKVHGPEQKIVLNNLNEVIPLCIESIYSFIIYIIYIIVQLTQHILYRQRLKRHVSTYKVIVRLAKNYENITKWLRALGIPDGLKYVP